MDQISGGRPVTKKAAVATDNLLTGRMVRLREVTLQDAPLIVAWRNDPVLLASRFRAILAVGRGSV